MHVRRLATLAVLAVLAGCNGSEADEPKTSPSPSISTTAPTPDPTPTGPVAPTPPPEMEKANKAGARMFAEYYWELANYAQATGDTTALRAAQLPLCKACTGALEAVEEIYEKGWTIHGGDHKPTVLSLERLTKGQITEFRMLAEVNINDQLVRNEAGQIEIENPASTLTVDMIVGMRASKDWAVVEWEITR